MVSVNSFLSPKEMIVLNQEGYDVEVNPDNLDGNEITIRHRDSKPLMIVGEGIPLQPVVLVYPRVYPIFERLRKRLTDRMEKINVKVVL